MASAPPSDSALPPLIRDRVGLADRLVVLASASEDALALARSMSAEFEIGLVVTGGSDGVPHEPPARGDLLVHGVPDVFGRVLDSPRVWEALIVVDRMCGSAPIASPWQIHVGDEPVHAPATISLALAQLDKHLRQQRRVRPLFSSPPAMGLPYIAPEGVTLPGAFGRVEMPTVPGLPDLVVVRPHGDPATLR